MAPQYAKDQPAGFINRIEKVAIVGAGGRVGGHIAEELLKTGKHTVTALTREDSKSQLPSGIHIAKINYDDQDSLVAALQGQQFLIITLPVRGSFPEYHSKLVAAAAAAGVPYLMPNSWGYDIFNPALGGPGALGAPILQYVLEVEKVGASKYVALVCGQWYEWSMALGEACYGFDIKGRRATFLDGGKTLINSSTWRLCGRAVAALLSCKILPEDADDEEPTVSRWDNRGLYVSSFAITQRDMLDSLNRVLGTTDDDWEISYESSKERFESAFEELKKGNDRVYAKVLYSRIFFPTGDAYFEGTKGIANSVLGLPKEDLDEATKRAVDMVESGWNPFAG